MIGAGHSVRQSGWTMIAATNAKAARMSPTRPYRAASLAEFKNRIPMGRYVRKAVDEAGEHVVHVDMSAA